MAQKWFEYESGHAWCESAYKYQTLPFVAEYANTVTNLPIIILPMVNVMLIRKYLNEVNFMIFWPHLLLTINGLASAYYHATINLFGQLVDELSLVWLLTICLSAYLPTMKWYPEKYHKHIPLVRSVIGVVTVIVSMLCFMEPSVNAIALMIFSVPSMYIIYYEGRNSGIPETVTLVNKVFILWSLAASFWVADRFLCDLWLYLGTPYLHAFFHLFASYAGYTVFMMFSIIDISKRSKTHTFVAKLKQFPPQSKAFFSLHYITVRDKRDH
uniref:Alkaline ceramidase n=1 Tax=Rhabditophanes sp. KR3021 TaxID=114890 RepID=A0AC35U696_9BILA